MATTALPAGERARPTRTRAVQSATRGGRARSQPASTITVTEGNARRSNSKGADGLIAEHGAAPDETNTTEEWNELAMFARTSESAVRDTG